jgi:hypothetical protein
VPKLARQALLLIGLTLLDLIFSTFILPFLHLLTCVYIVCATSLRSPPPKKKSMECVFFF